MQNIINAVERLMPESISVFKLRYKLLQKILQKGLVGRRVLVQELELSERTVRAEIERLESQGLIDISSKGMSITIEGENVLSILYKVYHEMDELNTLEEQIVAILGLKKAIVVKGDLVTDDIATNFGLAFRDLLEGLLTDNMTIAITGGSTVYQLVDNMPEIKHGLKALHILPARGSVGKRVELQASTIATMLADKLEAKYEMFTIPDNLSNQSIKLIKNEPEIEKLLQKLSKTDIIIFGIGSANKMAKKRKESEEILELLDERHAVAEAFRHYFDADGHVVYKSDVIGVSPEMAVNIPYRIAAASSAEKAEAILASKSLLKGSYLILDESLAKALIESTN